jgi:2-haloacid dehalogenase
MTHVNPAHQPGQTRRNRLLVFDVNETLLDIEALKPFFARNFGDERVLRQWFGEQILYSEALTLAGQYTPFGYLAEATLGMLATVHGVELTREALGEFRAMMSALPAHRDVEPALNALAGAGFRMVALTNSPRSAGESSLRQAGIGDFFEAVYSVDAVGRFKPAAQAYAYAAGEFGVEPQSCRLIACHAWDTLGAMAAGYAAALVARPGNAALPWGPQPDIIAATLDQVAARIIRADT